jgi:TusA-related sulfurtransferase
MKEIVPDYRLDMVGEPCPYPAVATLEALPQLKKGEILEVVSDCPQSINNIRWMPETTAIRCWISSRMGQPFAI